MSPAQLRGSLDGLVAIVSGSSAGIGAATARELSARGARVAINYPYATLRREAEEVCSSLATPGIIVEADMSTVDGPNKLVEETIRRLGRLEILVNNASILGSSILDDVTMELWESVINTNARSVLLLTRAAAPRLTKGRGRIVNIISTSSRAPLAGQTLLAGTKGMVESFSRCWAKELPPKYGCTVNSVSPGPTKTPGFQKASGELSNELEKIFVETPVAHRAAEPSEIAYAIAMLCEEAARWINGTHVLATGGLVVD